MWPYGLKAPLLPCKSGHIREVVSHQRDETMLKATIDV